MIIRAKIRHRSRERFGSSHVTLVGQQDFNEDRQASRSSEVSKSLKNASGDVPRDRCSRPQCRKITARSLAQDMR